MHHEEIEVKFILDNAPTIRQRLLAIGAHLKTPRTYEYNLCFDTSDQRLKRRGQLLRLRHDRRAVLTYKEPPATDDADFKVRDEYETGVSDYAQARAILEKLGFFPTLCYEKYRETFTYQKTEILLDETPVGTFMEIEGPRESIRRLTSRLGLDCAVRLTASYGEIFEAVRTTYHLTMTDLTFENFQRFNIDLHTCHLT